jgi:hypothetical protein
VDDADAAASQPHYALGRERDRLTEARGMVGFERTREIVLRHLTAIRNDMVVGGGLVAVSLVGVLAAAALSVCDLRRAARLQLSSPGWTTSVRVPALHRGSSSHLRLGARGVET